MHKRDFLKCSAAVAADLVLGGVGEPIAAAAADVPRMNWSGNYHYSTNNVFTPATVSEVQDAVRGVRAVRGLGTRHSFNGIADSQVAQISTLGLKSFELDARAHTVTVGSGLRYGDLAMQLDARGFALHNLASLPHISVGGACATATHGSGRGNGNLATAVRAIELVTADGTVHRLARDTDGDRFAGAVVCLGAIGIVTRLTLDVQPRFEMTQVVYQNLPFSTLEHHLADVMGAGYSVSLFTDWQHDRAGEVWIKRRVDQGGSQAPSAMFYGAELATAKLHPIAGHPAEACTDQLNEVGPWYERLPHFKMDFTPSSGQEIQTEYFVPFARGYEAIRAVAAIAGRITPHLFVSEIRAVAADNLWMSMAYQRPSLALHFTWKPDQGAVNELVPQIEASLAPLGARPHWAKVFSMRSNQVSQLYPRLQDFGTLAAEFDPKGVFRNDFLREHVYGR